MPDDGERPTPTSTTGRDGRSSTETANGSERSISCTSTRDTDRPEWAGVLNLHLLGMRPALVPLRRASTRGRQVRVPNVTKEQVRNAPHVEPDLGLSDEDEELLATYYRLRVRRPTPPKPPTGPRRRPPRPPGLPEQR